jgi:predicted unusual protein kinase regulating ubiquinone biosynthesis (AarF/ABC1/UbiB family)
MQSSPTPDRRRPSIFWRVFGRALRILLLLLFMLLEYLLDRLKLRWVWWWITGSGEPYVWHKNEVIVREAFEHMGPTFVKLGQVVASSPGLFPKRYAEEFSKCLDQVPSFGITEVEAIIEKELGRPISEVFDRLEREPLGSASIAQVHGATLKDGRQVVIKVQRPGIGDVVDADLWWMARGAFLLELIFHGARLANLTGLIEDFGRTIHDELDFHKEAANQHEFNAIMSKHKITDVRAPEPIDHLVTNRVLVMERFYGFKIDDVVGIAAASIDHESCLRTGMRAWLLTVMLEGFFHGDVHAGNLMVLPEGPSVGCLDFGIIGRFDREQRHQILRYVLGLGARDFGAMADVMMEIGAVGEQVDREGFVAVLEETYSPLVTKSVQDIRYDEVLTRAVSVALEFGVRVPKEFMLVLKQLLFFDRYAKAGAPDLNVFSDYYLVDFLFTPAAMKAGLDFNVLLPLLQGIQALNRAEEADDA